MPPFTFPAPLPSKNLSKNTIKMYKSLLNKIAKNVVYRDFVNVTDKTTGESIKQPYESPTNNILLLQAHHKEVIDYISNLEEDNTFKRRYCSAIFWILHDTNFLTPENPYRLYNRTIQDTKPGYKKTETGFEEIVDEE